MRIGIDARMYGSAFGIGRYIEQITRRVLAAGHHDHTFVLFVADTALAPGLIREGVDAEIVVAPERWYSWSEQVTWPLRIRRQRLDLLFVPQFNVPLLIPVPFVVTIHDVTQLHFPGTLQKRSWVHRLATRLTFWHALRHARAVITVSEYTKGEILKHFRISADKLRVIYEGPGLPLQDTDKTEQVEDAPYILAVSVWRKHKNFEGLLEAFALLRENPEYADFKLMLVGEEDPRYPDVRAAISRLGLTSSVLTPGAVSDERLDALYAHAALMVVPSFLEGFALTALEALRRGTPVAASDVAALPEVLNGAASYFDPARPEDMAATITTMLSDADVRRQTLAHADDVLARCSWERAAAETSRVLIQAAEHAPDMRH